MRIRILANICLTVFDTKSYKYIAWKVLFASLCVCLCKAWPSLCILLYCMSEIDFSLGVFWCIYVCVYNSRLAIWSTRCFSGWLDIARQWAKKGLLKGMNSNYKNNPNTLFNINDVELFIYYHQLTNWLSPKVYSTLVVSATTNVCLVHWALCKKILQIETLNKKAHQYVNLSVLRPIHLTLIWHWKNIQC